MIENEDIHMPDEHETVEMLKEEYEGRLCEVMYWKKNDLEGKYTARVESVTLEPEKRYASFRFDNDTVISIDVNQTTVEHNIIEVIDKDSEGNMTVCFSIKVLWEQGNNTKRAMLQTNRDMTGEDEIELLEKFFGLIQPETFLINNLAGLKDRLITQIRDNNIYAVVDTIKDLEARCKSLEENNNSLKQRYHSFEKTDREEIGRLENKIISLTDEIRSLNRELLDERETHRATNKKAFEYFHQLEILQRDSDYQIKSLKAEIYDLLKKSEK